MTSAPYLYHLRERKPNQTMTAFAATFATTLAFAAAFAILALLLTPRRHLPDYQRGGWGRYCNPN
jgi:hypothetical protein